MIVNTNEVIYDDGRESSIIHFSNNHIHAPIRIGSQLIIFSWCSSKKKRTSSNGEVCQMSISGAFDHSRTSKKTEERKKKGKIFTQNVTLFWRTRARERVHIYTEVDKMSGNTDVEKGNFAVKAGLAQVRDSHPRELARFSSVDGFSFLLRRRRHRLSPFSWRLSSSSSVLHFFASHDDSYKSSQQREFKRKKSVDDDR